MSSGRFPHLANGKIQSQQTLFYNIQVMSRSNRLLLNYSPSAAREPFRYRRTTTKKIPMLAASTGTKELIFQSKTKQACAPCPAGRGLQTRLLVDPEVACAPH